MALPIFLLPLYFLNFMPVEALLVLAALLFWIFLVAKIELGLYLMAFFLPVIHWDFFIWKLQIPLIDLLGVFALAAFFTRHAILTYLGPATLRPKLIWPFRKTFIFFFTAVLASSFFSPTILDSLWYGVRWILFFYLAYLVFPINVIKDEKILKKTMLAVVCSASLVGLMSLASLYGQDWRNEFVRIRPIAIADVYPLGANQNLLVEALLPAIFYLLAFRQYELSRRTKRFLNLVFLFLALVLIGTFSRGGWLALAACLSAGAMYRYRQSIRRFILPIAGVLIVLTPVFYYMYLMQTDYYIGVGSNQSRIVSSQVAWQAFADKPLLGNGSGEYMNIIANNVRFRAKFGDPLESHGVLQKIMAENGLFGLAGFLLFVWLIFRYFYKGIKTLSKYDLIYLYLVLGGSAVFIFEIFNTSYYKGKLWFPIALALASASIFYKKEKNEGKKV